MHGALYSFNADGAKAKLESALGFIHNKQFQFELKRELAADLRRIIRRTQDGKDKNEAPFKVYSKGYAAAKQAKGRTGKVDLTFSGAMLQGLQVDTNLKETRTDVSGSIFMSGAEAEKARRHIAGDGVPKRDFLGFSKEFDKRVNKLIRSFISGRK